MKAKVKTPLVYGCPVCGGKRLKRTKRHIVKRREAREWQKDWSKNP